MQRLNSKDIFLASMAEEVVAKFGKLDTLITHAPSRGVYHENILRNMIKEYLPPSFSVGDGFIIDIDSSISSQTDIIVVDNLDPRSYGFKSGDFFLASEFAVTTFGEVKTSVNYKRLAESFEKNISTAKLIDRPPENRPTSFIFCFNASVSKKTIDKWMLGLTKQYLSTRGDYIYMPDYVFFYNDGLVFRKLENSFVLQEYITTDDTLDNAERKDIGLKSTRMSIISDLIKCINIGALRLRSLQHIAYPRRIQS